MADGAEKLYGLLGSRIMGEFSDAELRRIYYILKNRKKSADLADRFLPIVDLAETARKNIRREKFRV